MKQFLKVYRIVLALLTILCVFLFVISIILDANKKAIILFNMLNSGLAFLLLIIVLILFCIYLILLGIYIKKILISFVPLLFIYPIIVLFVVFGITTRTVDYKVKINSLNEKLAVVHDISLHDTYNTLYEREFLFIYKKIQSFSDTLIGNEECTSFIVNEDKVIIQYKYNDKLLEEKDIIYYDYENKTFYSK